MILYCSSCCISHLLPEPDQILFTKIQPLSFSIQSNPFFLLNLKLSPPHAKLVGPACHLSEQGPTPAVWTRCCLPRRIYKIWRGAGSREKPREVKKWRERKRKWKHESERTGRHEDTMPGWEGVCVCMSKAREDENEMFLRPWRGKESFYVDSGETSLKGICQRNVPVSWEWQLRERENENTVFCQQQYTPAVNSSTPTRDASWEKLEKSSN